MPYLLPPSSVMCESHGSSLGSDDGTVSPDGIFSPSATSMDGESSQDPWHRFLQQRQPQCHRKQPDYFTKKHNTPSQVASGNEATPEERVNPPLTNGYERPYHPKRPHKKSRTGCKNCKARKVKCDEGRPKCRSCMLRKTECVYAFPPSRTPNETRLVRPRGAQQPLYTFSQTMPPMLASISSPGQLLGRRLAYCPVPLSNFDVQLLRFYEANTANSFTMEPGSQLGTILRVHLIQLALHTPFLMASLLALVSIHMQSLGYAHDRNRGIEYRHSALAGYREAIEAARPENFPALIGSSLLMTALASNEFRGPNPTFLYIVNWMTVWKGIGIIVERIGTDALWASGLAELFYRPRMNTVSSFPAVPECLKRMASSIPPHEEDVEASLAYFQTLKCLGTLYTNLRTQGISPIMNLRIITWLTFIPRGFIKQCQDRKPRALVTLAHYAAFLKLIKNVWWMKDIGQQTLKDISGCLGAEWEHVLQVPFSVMQTEPREEIVRIILQDSNWKSPRRNSPALKEGAPIEWTLRNGTKISWLPKQQKVIELDGAENDVDPWI